MMILRLFVFVSVWLLFLAIKIPTVISGLVVVPLLYPFRSQHYDTLPSWTRPWANPEDWQGGMHGVVGASVPQWWIYREGLGLWSFWKYHAIRNPANGLRSFELLDLDIQKEQVKYRTNQYMRHYAPWYARPMGISTYWYLAWQGVKAGFLFVHHWNDERHMEIKIGWRVHPRHAVESGEGLLHDDAGFATKVLPYRKG